MAVLLPKPECRPSRDERCRGVRIVRGQPSSEQGIVVRSCVDQRRLALLALNVHVRTAVDEK